MYLARVISLAKWQPRPDLASGEISADAVTADLRTSGNALSFWGCGHATRHEVDEAVLAIAAARDRVQKVDIAWVLEEDLVEDGQRIGNTQGRTPVADLADHHVDVSHLDYHRLGQVAYRVAAAIKDSQYKRITARKVVALLTNAVREGRLSPSDLATKVRDKVQEALLEP